MTTRGRRSNRSGWRPATAPIRSRSRSPTRRGGRSRRRAPGRSAPGRRRAGSRRAAGSDRRRRPSPGRRPLDEAADRERRAERVGIGVLMADGEHVASRPDALDDGTRDGVRATARGRSSVRGGPAPVDSSRLEHAPARRAAGRRGGRSSPTGGSASPSCGSRATGVGSDSPIAASSVGSWPASSSFRRWRTRVPRSSVSSSSRWNCGIRLMRSRLPSSCWMNGIARPSAGQRRLPIRRPGR